MSELSALIIRRGQLKGQLTRFSSYIKDKKSNIDVEQLVIRKDKIKEVWGDFHQVQIQIEEESGITEESEIYRTEFEDIYFHNMAECERMIKSVSTDNFNVDNIDNNSRTATPTYPFIPPSIKLAALQIPNFSGKYTEWPSYYDIFTALVHNNNSLSDVQKFFYLRSSLSGEAEKSILCLQTTADNYQKAWDSLIERYNNQRILIQVHTKSLFDLEAITSESAEQIRKLYDSLSGYIKALETLGQKPFQWGSLLSHLITVKLDSSTLRQWEIESYKYEDISIECLLEFLKTRSRILEAVESTSNRNSILKQSREHTKLFKKYPSKSTCLVTSAELQCYFCKHNHTIYRCPAFTKLSVSERIKSISTMKHCKNCLKSHIGEKCMSKRCSKCGRAHNVMLHLPRYEKTDKENESNIHDSNKESIEISNNEQSLPSTSINAHLYRYNVNKQVLLSTAIVYTYNHLNQPVLCRVLLDSGSQNNFITELMANQLKLKREKITCSVFGINQSNHSVSYQISTKIKSRTSDYEVNLNFLVLPKLTSHIPSVTVDLSNIHVPRDITLADPSFDTPQKIDMLLGAEIFFDLMCNGQLKPVEHGPIFKNTNLGWIVSGPVADDTRKTNTSMSYYSNVNISFVNLENKINKFWQLEELSDKTVYSLEERKCKDYFDKNIIRDNDGRYVVSLPFHNLSKLGKSHNIAVRRFLNLERRLQSEPELKKEYIKFMDEYLSLGHMELIPPNDVVPESHCNYIPHHAVRKEDSLTTKLRVVFDASCKTDNGVSLNDVLLKGPSIQQDLIFIMTRFRTHRFVLSADITKMYRQIWVSKSHQDAQRIVWRSNINQTIKTYRLKTVTYGVVTSSYLATACLENLAEQNSDQYPKACRAIRQDFYMDDLLTGANTIQETMHLRDDIRKILSTAGFELRQWSSNEPVLLNNLITAKLSCTKNIITDNEQIKKLLGIYWNSKNDTYQYHIQSYNENSTITKRNVLSDIASIFDPLGLISPIIIRFKIIMQKLWLSKVGWDDVLPTELQTEWQRYRRELESINTITINRCLIGPGEIKDVQLHGFADASIKAYGACLFLRTVNVAGEITVRLICSKSRVAPLKVVSLPRLELLAALLLARLTSKYASTMQIQISEKYYWSDSKVVLAWIASESSRWKTFVSHRVSEIQELSVISQWKYVNTKENPADLVSRGCNPVQIKDNRLWWEGPKWLRKNIIDWPKNDFQYKPNIDILSEERKVINVLVVSLSYDISILNRYSSLNKLIRVVSYCRRFINNSKSINVKINGPLQAYEIDNATVCIIKLVQSDCWSEEIHALNNSREISSKSKLLQLKPFLDERGLIRVGGRLKNTATLDIFQKHPIPLPANSPFTKLVFSNEHQKTLHGGPQIMLSGVREKYWPFNGRNIARKTVQNCVMCFRYRPVVVQPIMGNLPQTRIEPAKPFQKVGVDFAGPFSLKQSQRRNAPISKAYACLWVCFVTKAVHIELVGDLTTQSFLNALKRFCDRRGLVTEIYSDNATNFVGANRKLTELKRLFSSSEHQEKVQGFLSKNNIQWHFIPARSPHFGGLWEAAIKSMKSHLYKTLGNASLTFEELYSVLVRIEAILNSRPISPLSSDPLDFSALTPGHFLTGDIFKTFPEEDVSTIPLNRLNRWRRVRQFTQQLWIKWRHDYLLNLQTRKKWSKSAGPALAVNTVVLLRDDNYPPLQWRIGRVTEVQPGSDGVVRVATVRTSDGIFKRAVRQLCPLPFEGNQPKDGNIMCK